MMLYCRYLPIMLAFASTVAFKPAQMNLVKIASSSNSNAEFRRATSVLRMTDSMNENAAVPLEPSTTSSTESKSSTKLVTDELTIATGLGGFVVGLFTGGISDGVFFDGDAPWLPIVGSILLGGGTFYVSGLEENFIAELSKDLLGKPIITTRNSITQKIRNQIQSVKSSVTRKVDEIVTDVTNIPNKINQARINAIEGAKKSSVQAVDNLKTAIVKKVDNTVSEVSFFIHKKSYTL